MNNKFYAETSVSGKRLTGKTSSKLIFNNYRVYDNRKEFSEDMEWETHVFEHFSYTRGCKHCRRENA